MQNMKIIKTLLFCFVCFFSFSATADESCKKGHLDLPGKCSDYRCEKLDAKAWEALLERAGRYRKTLSWDNSQQWEADVELLKNCAIAGRSEALHELFLLADHVDGVFVDVLGTMLSQVIHAQPTLYRRQLKKEPRKIREIVEFIRVAGTSDPID